MGIGSVIIGEIIAHGRSADRRGFDYPLHPPESAIDPSEDKVSIEAAMAIRATFAQGSGAVRALFDALVE